MTLGSASRELAFVLHNVLLHDESYEIRYGLVLQALHLAYQAGLDCGIRVDPKEPKWPVVYIELPTGQVSWHMPQHVPCWDGHTTEEKERRTRTYIRNILSASWAPLPARGIEEDEASRDLVPPGELV